MGRNLAGAASLAIHERIPTRAKVNFFHSTLLRFQNQPKFAITMLIQSKISKILKFENLRTLGQKYPDLKESPIPTKIP